MLSIGQFSRACSVSVKTLRHYEKIGLLVPARVDDWTGYRFYDESQIATMLLIGRLKLYGFSLHEISVFISLPENNPRLVGMLKDRRQALRTELERITQVLWDMDRHLSVIERTGNIMDYQKQYRITVEEAPALPILALRQRMSLNDFGSAYGKLYEQAAREQLELTGTVIAIYHDEGFDPEESDIEVALGVKDEARATRRLDGGAMAVTTHIGSYSGLADAYGALSRWVQENGWQLRGAPYEIYLKNSLTKTPINEWETKIFFPIEKKTEA